MTVLEDVSAIGVLTGEHRVIEKVLDALDTASVQMREGREIPVDSITKILIFSQSFVDRCHHGKEESCLFPCLEKRGIPREGGPIEVMLYEHQVGRELAAEIQAELGRCRAAKSDGLKLADLCTKYVAHVRQHILKEERVLFRMGELVMNDVDHKTSLACYERTEEEKLGEGKHEELLRLADEIKPSK